MRAILILCLLTLAATGCQAIPLRIGSWEVPSESVLFQDDFSNPESGWTRLREGSGSESDYADGAYRISINESNRLLWSGPGLRFDDVRIQVEATKTAGPEDDDYGIVCRAQDKRNFYFLVVSSDGYYGIGKVKDGVQTLIGMQAMLPSEAIIRGNATNTLRADCVGDTLSLFANGVQLGSAQDGEWPSGEAGLLAGTFDIPGTEIHFTNFTVIKP